MNLGWAVAIAGTVGLAQAAPRDRAVAITIDDLPAAGAKNPDEDPALTTDVIREINTSMLAALGAHHVPATAFVNERGIAAYPDALARRRILAQWTAAGMDLGNHTYSHADVDGVSLEEFEREIERGEATVRRLMREAGKKLTYFRFPMNHTGGIAARREAIAEYLARRGYKTAASTIENEDYEFERAFRLMLATHDVSAAKKLRADYLQYTAAEIDYYAALHRQIFGRETAHVMLLHANRLNAELIGDILRMFEARHYRFVSLAEAQADPAFLTPDTFATKFGPMWGYRWAHVLGIRVDGSKELEAPDWIRAYGRNPTAH
jgi:peptidoglycan/xylan/chitin deacetylase (PgdA/CDA1 family)